MLSYRDVPKSFELLKTSYGRTQHQRLAKLEYSAGVISFNWGVSTKLDKLLHHNVFMSGKALVEVISVE